MTPRLSHLVVGAILAIGVVFGALIGIAHVAQKISGKAEASAKIEEKKADAHAQVAQQSDTTVADLKTKLLAQEKDLARLLEERNSLRRKLLQPPPPGPDQVSPTAPQGQPVPDPRDALLAKDNEVLAAYSKRVDDQSVVIGQLTISRDQWKAAYSDEKRLNVSLQISLDAQKALNKSSKWLYRGQGLVIGFGVGYVAGRLH